MEKLLNLCYKCQRIPIITILSGKENVVELYCSCSHRTLSYSQYINELYKVKSSLFLYGCSNSLIHILLLYSSQNFCVDCRELLCSTCIKDHMLNYPSHFRLPFFVEVNYPFENNHSKHKEEAFNYCEIRRLLHFCSKCIEGKIAEAMDINAFKYFNFPQKLKEFYSFKMNVNMLLKTIKNEYIFQLKLSRKGENYGT